MGCDWSQEAYADENPVPSSTPDPCDNGDLYVTKPEDAETISECSLFNGNVIITSAPGGYVALDGVNAISGNVVAQNVSQLSVLSANNLASIEGTFDLEDLAALSFLNFPSLTSVSNIQWANLPFFQTYLLGEGSLDTQNISIRHTALGNFSNINVTSLGSLYVANNLELQDIHLSELANVTGAIEIVANSWLSSVNFPLLEQAGSLSFSNTSSLSLPALTSVDDGFICDHGNLDSLTLPNLTAIGGALSMSGNNELLNADFPLLRATGGSIVAQLNTNLANITFPNLNTVAEDLILQDNMPLQSIDFDNLTAVKGKLQLNGNTNLQDANFPVLMTVGSDFTLQNNNISNTSLPNLARVGGNFVVQIDIQPGGVAFNKLAIVEGNASMEGVFNFVSLPSLSDIEGPVQVTTLSTNHSICDFFENAKSLRIIKGDVECITAKLKHKLSKGAAVGIAFGILIAVAICVLIYYCCYRRRKPDADEDNRDEGDAGSDNSHSSKTLRQKLTDGIAHGLSKIRRWITGRETDSTGSRASHSPTNDSPPPYLEGAPNLLGGHYERGNIDDAIRRHDIRPEQHPRADPQHPPQREISAARNMPQRPTQRDMYQANYRDFLWSIRSPQARSEANSATSTRDGQPLEERPSASVYNPTIAVPPRPVIRIDFDQASNGGIHARPFPILAEPNNIAQPQRVVNTNPNDPRNHRWSFEEGEEWEHHYRQYNHR